MGTQWEARHREQLLALREEWLTELWKRERKEAKEVSKNDAERRDRAGEGDGSAVVLAKV